MICSDSGGEDVIGVRRAAEARMSDCECSGRGVSEQSCTVCSRIVGTGCRQAERNTVPSAEGWWWWIIGGRTNGTDERTTGLTFACSGLPSCHGHRWRAESEGSEREMYVRARGVMFQEDLPPPNERPALNVFLEAGPQGRG